MQISDPTTPSSDYAKANHYRWMRGLKVGDRVCNCQFRHLQISAIEEDRVLWVPKFWRRLCCADWMPEKIGDLLYHPWEWLSSKLGIYTLHDKSLTLEDGSQCSALHCCDPVSHAWSHILKSKTDIPPEEVS